MTPCPTMPELTGRTCIECEGCGVKRDYWNRAGDYTKSHCIACGGTGREVAAPAEVKPCPSHCVDGWLELHGPELEIVPCPHKRHKLVQRIDDYFQYGGLFNPELANHTCVRYLLWDLRTYIANHEGAR